MPRGVDWDVDGQVDLIRRLAGYAPELAAVPLGPEHRPGEFVWNNGAFGGADGYAYYGLLRELKPRHVVEVGAGASSLILGRALEANGGRRGRDLDRARAAVAGAGRASQGVAPRRDDRATGRHEDLRNAR